MLETVPHGPADGSPSRAFRGARRGATTQRADPRHPRCSAHRPAGRPQRHPRVASPLPLLPTVGIRSPTFSPDGALPAPGQPARQALLPRVPRTRCSSSCFDARGSLSTGRRSPTAPQTPRRRTPRHRCGRAGRVQPRPYRRRSPGGTRADACAAAVPLQLVSPLLRALSRVPAPPHAARYSRTVAAHLVAPVPSRWDAAPGALGSAA